MPGGALKVAVTGANGFIGRHLVRELAEAGHTVLSVSRQAEAPAGSHRHCSGDVLSPDSWLWVDSVDCIVHLAALSDASLSYQRPLDYNAINAVGTLVGLESARHAGTKFILASSQRVYRPSAAAVTENAPLDPIDPYGYSKLVAEHWVGMYHRVYGLPTTVLRFFSVYGPGQTAGNGASGVVALFGTSARRDDALVVYGTAWRDFTYVGDLVRGVRLAAENLAANGETFNIATGVATTTEDLAHLVAATSASRSAVRVEDRLKVGESYVADVTRARLLLGFQSTVSLRQGLEHYDEWLRGQS